MTHRMNRLMRSSVFGKEIGADRIYIFEDSQKENITNNTYEWCADGVKPEIDNLQELSMDVIKWWYDCFEKGENIIIRDMEEIKEEYPDSYKLLRGQNIDRLVVSSFGSDCEIRGFSGWTIHRKVTSGDLPRRWALCWETAPMTVLIHT